MSEQWKLRKQFRETDDPPPIYIQPWFKHYLDREKKKYWGKTPRRWFEVFLFYIAFYLSLAALCAICYAVFSTTLTDDLPRWNQKQPGLSAVPCSKEVEHCCLEFFQNNEDDLSYYQEKLDNFLQRHPTDIVDYFGPCNSNNLYGYNIGKPCIFLKVNRIIGFEPDPYDRGNQFPATAPVELKNYVEELPRDQRKNRIWLSCKGDDGVVVDFFPKDRSVKADLILFKKKTTSTDEAFARVVAIQISGLRSGKISVIRCYIWARNIEFEDYHGQVHIEIRLKDKR